MKVIDAHIHFRSGVPHFDLLAKQAGHENSEKHLRAVFADDGITRAVVMSNLSMEPEGTTYPDFLSYCAEIGRAHV